MRNNIPEDFQITENTRDINSLKMKKKTTTEIQISNFIYFVQTSIFNETNQFNN